MNVGQSVVAFLHRNPKRAFCDACIQKRLHLKQHKQAQQATAPLVSVPGFSQIRGLCFNCGEHRKTTAALLNPPVPRVCD